MSFKAVNDPNHRNEECENGIKTSQSYATRSATLCSKPSDNGYTSPLAEAERKDILEAATMVLSGVDVQSYESAVIEDSYTIMENHTFPKSFPWHKPRAPLLQALPRDIDDMPGVLHAGHPRQHSAFGFNNGVFGFGAFDQGGSRKVTSENSKITTPAVRQILVARDSSVPLSPKKCQKEGPMESCEDFLAGSERLRAAARRSNDPGVIELTVTLPPPISLESALVSCQMDGILRREPWLRFDKKSIRKAKAMVEAERAEISACMPLYWDKVDKASPFNPPAFIKNSVDEILIDKGDKSSTELTVLHRAKVENKRKLDLKALVQSCTRKWNVSVRVGGVSSRSSLFGSSPSNNSLNFEINDSSTKIEPLYCQASFSSLVQIGKIVALETAMQMDNDGLASSLGSYDCRAGATNPSMSFQAMEDITKKDAAGRAKKINVGRTRLIWSGIRFGNNNKVSYTSLTSGQKLDTTSYKRPREVKVAVSLNGELLEMPPADGRSPSKKPIHLAVFPEGPPSPVQKINNSFSGNIVMVEESIKNASSSCVQTRGKKSVVSKRNSSKIEGEYAMCMLDGEAFAKFVSKKPKFSRTSKIKKEDQFVPMKYGGTSILKHIPAQLTCLPLDDGFFRTYREVSGNLQATSVHHLLNLVARNSVKEEILCSICWTGNKTGPVLKCVSCDLLAHSDCCYDHGNFISETEVKHEERCALQASGKLREVMPWRCSVCQDSLKPIYKPQPSSDDKSGLPLCGSRKSSRTLKTPARFNDDADIDKNSFLQKKKPRKPRPNPKCALCPHSGGAMSVLLEERREEDGEMLKQWAHEICRLWCAAPRRRKSNIEVTPAGSLRGMIKDALPQKPMVCAICGTGKLLNESTEKKNTLQKKAIIDDSQVSDVYFPGLIKCAAVGCSVMFHPMCATLVTRLMVETQDVKDEEKSRNDHNLSHKKRIDLDLCQRYTLEVIEVTREEGLYGSLSGTEKSCVIPVGFCGIHNPNREPSFYGSHPAGNQFSSMISIPFQ